MSFPFLLSLLAIAIEISLPTRSFPDEVKKSVQKCCPYSEYIYYRGKKCVPYNGTSLDISLKVYNEKLELSKRAFEDVFYLESNAFRNSTFRKKVLDAIQMDYNIYLKMSGVLFLEEPNAYKRWTPVDSDKFCLDYVRRKQPSGQMTFDFAVFWLPSLDNFRPPPQRNELYRIGMTISCVSLGLVLLVYLMLPELQNTAGQVLVAYVASLLCAFVCVLILQRGDQDNCRVLSFLTYFFLILSFCWMNVLSCDIWWTFRGFIKVRPIHRRGVPCKFFKYSMFAFGVSGTMTAVLAVLNDAGMRRYPWFVTPGIADKTCFMEGGKKLYYLYMPMLIMIIFNWLFFLMTAFNICRLHRGDEVLGSAAGTSASHRRHKQRFWLYMKLSVVMGINWLFEVVTAVTPDAMKNVWFIFDAYNSLVGLMIFLIFVCKKKIFKKLWLRILYLSSHCSEPSSSSAKVRSFSDLETSCNSLDATGQINSNPKGTYSTNLSLNIYKPNENNDQSYVVNKKTII